MKNFSLSILTTIFLLSLVIPISAQLADTPWPCFHHDIRHTGRSPYVGPEIPKLNWKFDKGVGYGYSSPAIGVDGVIYVDSVYDYLYAIGETKTPSLQFGLKIEPEKEVFKVGIILN